MVLKYGNFFKDSLIENVSERRMEESLGTIDDIFESAMSDDLPCVKDKSIYVVAVMDEEIKKTTGITGLDSTKKK